MAADWRRAASIWLRIATRIPVEDRRIAGSQDRRIAGSATNRTSDGRLVLCAFLRVVVGALAPILRSVAQLTTTRERATVEILPARWVQSSPMVRELRATQTRVIDFATFTRSPEGTRRRVRSRQRSGRACQRAAAAAAFVVAAVTLIRSTTNLPTAVRHEGTANAPAGRYAAWSLLNA